MITYLSIPAASDPLTRKYVRLIVLTGTPQFKRWINYRPAVGSPATNCRYTNTNYGDLLTSAKNQFDEEPTSSNLLLFSKVGVNVQDLFGAFSWCYPDNEGVGNTEWPPLTDLNPVPVTTILP